MINKLKGSSETIRKTSFNFDAYLSVKPNHILNVNKHFLCWFIGFTEGDGCFHVDNNNHRNYFLISQKDPKALYYIKKMLGFGIVYKKEISYQYYVSDQINIDILIKIFNGNLQLNKTKQRLSLWFNEYNSYTKIKNKSLLNSNIINKISLTNSWISGFIDAEGCFTASLRKDPRYKSGYKLVLRFILDQKFEKETLLYIGVLFGKNQIADRKELKDMHRLIIYSNFELLLNYLSNFPLKTTKKISFLRWKRLFFYTKQENLYSVVNNPKAFIKLQTLIKSLNNF